jgi:holo-[acyl-carrier protein] synthase
MLRSGVDVLEINRLVSMKRDHPEIYQRFVTRVFTENEIIEARDRVSYFAGRFAAKEAASKALHCGIGVLGWRSIEILTGEQGEPLLQFYEKAALLVEHHKISDWSVSISHTDALAIAFVMMQ